MKKLTIVLCLMFLCIALFNARVYAVSFVTYIENFEQISGDQTFTDDFSGTTEPVTGDVYDVEGTFGSTRQSGGRLELNLDDGIEDEEGLFLGVSVENNVYFFNSDDAGSVTGLFDISSGITSGAWFGVGIYNFPLDGIGEPDNDDAAFVNIGKNEFGTWASWGDETTWESGSPLGYVEITDILASESTTSLGIRISFDTSGLATAEFDFGSSWITLVPEGGDPEDFGISSAGFSTISFLSDDLYTGEFSAGEMSEPEPVPEPTTIALLGIGLAGLGGSYLRRRRKNIVD